MGNSQSSKVFREINEGNEEETITLLQTQKSVDFLSSNGISVMRGALEKNMFNLFKYCFQRNAVMTPALEKNRTILHRCVELAHYDFTWKLLRQSKFFRIEIDDQDNDGKTALHVAVEICSSDMVALLLKYNANKQVHDKSGKTPFDLAKEAKLPGFDSIIEQFTVKNLILTTAQPETALLKDQISTQIPKETKIELEKSAKIVMLERTLERLQIPLIKNEELELCEIINKGSSCLVYKGRWKNMDVAVKQFTTEYSESEKKMRKFGKELKVLTKIDHPQLLKLFGICVEKPNLCLVTELVPNFTLFYAIHKNKEKRLSLNERFSIATQLCRGIAYLHSNEPPIIHRDLKPENCLLDFGLNVKIADFGLARFASSFSHDEESMTTICIGTTRFMAPELFDSSRNESIGPEVDIWALGCLVIEIFSNKRPWHYISSSKANSIFFEIFNKKPIPVPENVLPEIAEIIRECCRYNPKRRPTASEVLEKLEAAKKIYISS